MTQKNMPVVKTHSLKTLVTLCGDIDACILTLEIPAEFLTPYATVGRYPDTYVSLKSYEAAELIKHARKIVLHILDKNTLVSDKKSH